MRFDKILTIYCRIYKIELLSTAAISLPDWLIQSGHEYLLSHLLPDDKILLTCLHYLPPITSNPQKTTDFLPLQGTDYVEFYVGNAKQAAHFYKTAFGFQSLAYAGPETGIKDKASYVVRQNKLTFVFTTALEDLAIQSPIMFISMGMV